MTCSFCGRGTTDPVPFVALGGESCPGCAVRLGRALVASPQLLEGVWPALREEADDDAEPEPRVRLPDGRLVELREHTAAMKQELLPEQRVELARTLGLLGLRREQILECGHVLAAEPPVAVSRVAVALLLARRESPKDALERIRMVLFPG